MKSHRILLIIASLLYLQACETTSNMGFKQPNVNHNRILVIGEEEYRAGKSYQFLTWKCRDTAYGASRTLVELGRILPPDGYKETDRYLNLNDEQKQSFDALFKHVGFILYDGTEAGDKTVYTRDGLRHRWSWGESPNSYSFIIKPDGNGLFFDFSTADENGMKSKADDVFKCSR